MVFALPLRLLAFGISRLAYGFSLAMFTCSLHQGQLRWWKSYDVMTGERWEVSGLGDDDGGAAFLVYHYSSIVYTVCILRLTDWLIDFSTAWWRWGFLGLSLSLLFCFSFSFFFSSVIKGVLEVIWTEWKFLDLINGVFFSGVWWVDVRSVLRGIIRCEVWLVLRLVWLWFQCFCWCVIFRN